MGRKMSRKNNNYYLCTEKEIGPGSRNLSFKCHCGLAPLSLRMSLRHDD